MAGRGTSGRRGVAPIRPAGVSTEAERARHPSSGAAAGGREPDPLGKMALYSKARPGPALGALVVECSSCRRETPVTPLELARATLPFSVHLPFVRRFSSFMRCPSCGRRTWVRVRWRLS